MYKYQPLLESLRLQNKADIKTAFCEDDSDKDIDFDSFHDCLNFKLDLNASLEDAQTLFYQIDVYSKGNIKYRNLASYLEDYEECRLPKDEGPYHPVPTLYQGSRCQDSIFEWTVYEEIEDSADEIAGHYVSLSRSGSLAFWRRDFKKHFEMTIAVHGVGDKINTMATGLACLPRYQMVAVATTAADIRFFSANTHNFEHRFSILWLPTVVVHMECWDSEKLTCGDFKGYVYVVSVFSAFFTKLRRRAPHLGPQKVTFDHLRKGRVAGLKYEETAKSHFTNVAKVKYLPSIRAVVSCSVNTERAMLIHHLDKNKSLSFTVKSGITCFDFCEKLNCVATGCIDNSVRIWNPAVNTSCSEALTGHSNSVTHVLVDEKRLFVISADRDKIIRVWNLHRPICMQVLNIKKAGFSGRQIFSALYLDNEYDKLIITTNRIAVLRSRRKVVRVAAHPDSELIVFAAFNGLFDRLITVGSKASVAVWSAQTCFLVHEFTGAHVTYNSTGIPQVVNVTAASLDPSERRLVTAGRDGSIKVWNFHLGVCLREFQVKFSVLALTVVGFEIFVSGSSRIISVFYDDGQHDLEGSKWKSVHEQAVVSVDSYSHNLLASASSDGEIVVWMWKIGDPKFRMRDVSEEGGGRAEDVESYPAKVLVEIRRRRGISQILFLQTREMETSVGNLVSCGVDGRIRFWSVNCTNKMNKGQLLSKFRAVFRKCDGVLCMATDRENKILLTGDTMGYIRTYELEDYYSSYGSIPANARQPRSWHYDKYPFLRLQRLVQANHSQHSKFDPDGGAEMGFAPLLLSCFRCHLGPVLKIAYSNQRELVATAARQGRVRLWTVSGTYIGYLGSDATDVGLMPPEIRAVASCLTLHVLNGGRKPYWERAMDALRRYRLGHASEEPKERPFAWITKREDLKTEGRLPLRYGCMI